MFRYIIIPWRYGNILSEWYYRYSFIIFFYNNADILFLSGCVGDDNAKGDSTDRGTCAANELCNDAGECLGA